MKKAIKVFFGIIIIILAVIAVILWKAYPFLYWDFISPKNYNECMDAQKSFTILFPPGQCTWKNKVYYR